MSSQGHMIDTILEEIKLQSALKLRRVLLIEEFTRESCYKVTYLINKIVDMDNTINLPMEDRKITIDISSYGGCVFSCLSLIGLIESLKEQGYTIITHINSIAMSAGFFLSIVGSHRTINRHGVGLIHPMISGTQGSLQAMIDDIEFDKVLWEKIVEITLKYTKFTREELDDIKRCKTDKYMTSQEMLIKGCVDEVI